MKSDYSPFVLKLPSNLKGRDFICGDLHGHYELLMQGLEHIHFDPSLDRIFAVGDLIDRGPESSKCMKLLNEKWFYSVMGNHEQMLLNRQHGSQNLWFKNGGLWWLNTSTDDRHELECLANELPTVIVVGACSDRFNIVHSELFSNRLFKDADIDSWHTNPTLLHNIESDLLWGRSQIKKHLNGGGLTCYADLSPTYVGHSEVRAPTWSNSHCFIETGAHSRGVLTIVEIQMKSNIPRQYWEITAHTSMECRFQD